MRHLSVISGYSVAGIGLDRLRGTIVLASALSSRFGCMYQQQQQRERERGREREKERKRERKKARERESSMCVYVIEKEGRKKRERERETNLLGFFIGLALHRKLQKVVR
jgi:hypothetical protein